MQSAPSQTPSRRGRIFLTGAALAALCSAALLYTYYEIRSSPVARVIEDPKVRLSYEELEAVVKAIGTGEVGGKERRTQLARAIVERYFHFGDGMLFTSLVARWQQTGEYEVILDLTAEAVASCRRKSPFLLNYISAADLKVARSLVDIKSLFRQCDDTHVLVGTILLMSKKSLADHTDACDHLLAREDVSAKVKETLRDKLQE